MAKGKNQWVSPTKDGRWAVQGEKAKKATAIFDTQKEATKRAREIATNQKSEVIVQRKDGRIRSKDSYGNAPCPPADKEH